MLRILSFILIFSLYSCSQNNTVDFDFTTTFEQSNGTQTPEYIEVKAYYKALSQNYEHVKMIELNQTDSGQPLHLVTYNSNPRSNSVFDRFDNQIVLLINNGIHPGESDGIDASMMLMRDLAQGKIKTPEHVIVAVIPVYNIGGALNRNSHSRTNQNGPEQYGFRGNARNFDLNRDFIKADTKNAKAFNQLLSKLNPEVFIDNHVSNGADYQYTLTHLFTQHNKLGGALGTYLHETLMPRLEDSLAQKQWDITPYVNVFNRTPESGFSQFMDSPRYSTGYTTLFNTLGMMVETHMLKPYKDRVTGTYAIMESMIAIVDQDAATIKEQHQLAAQHYKTGQDYPIAWAIDSSQTTTLNFKGYNGQYLPSEVTGANRLKYDTTAPFTKPVTYYNFFKPTQSVSIPEYYAIPQGFWPVIERLQWNGIALSQLSKDTTLTAEQYTITDYKTRTRPYEGHYSHYNTQVSSHQLQLTLKAGDYLVATDQPGVRYLLETLEPSAVDSFFNWNFFDTILQQKEGFSPYVWEDLALEFLNNNPEIKAEFEAKKLNEPNFEASWYMQLDWIHKQSPYYEAAHLRYPIYRVGG